MPSEESAWSEQRLEGVGEHADVGLFPLQTRGAGEQDGAGAQAFVIAERLVQAAVEVLRAAEAFGFAQRLGARPDVVEAEVAGRCQFASDEAVEFGALHGGEGRGGQSRGEKGTEGEERVQHARISKSGSLATLG